ncbi:MAG: hypothetical protein K6G38_02750 [Gammaproteobacteria bacterium]|nr:hypothetical protein [Gammaproteobacteria bacterium]
MKKLSKIFSMALIVSLSLLVLVGCKKTVAPTTTATDPTVTTTVGDEKVTYTITTSEALVTGKTVLLYLYNSAGDSEFIKVVPNGTTLAGKAKAGYDHAIIVILKEGETEIGDNWANKEVQYPEGEGAALTNNAATIQVSGGTPIVVDDVTYTFTVTNAIAAGRTVIAHMWDAAGNVTDEVLTQSNLTLTCEAADGFTGAVIVILKEGQTELGANWANKDTQSPDLAIASHAATWDNTPVVVENVTYTFTVTNAIESGRTVIAHMWGEGLDAVDKVLAINNLSLTCEAADGFTGAVIAVLKADQTELGANWVNVDNKSGDLTIADHAASWDNAPVVVEEVDYTFTVTNAVASGRTVIAHMWGEGLDAVDKVLTINNLSLTCKAVDGYTGAVLVVLKEGQTELGTNWANKDTQSPDLAIADHAAEWDNDPVVVEEVDYTFTVTNAIESGRTVIAHMWGDGVDAVDKVLTVNNLSLTCKAVDGYTGAVIAVLKEGKTSISNWDDDVETKSPDLTIAEHAATWDNAPVEIADRAYSFHYTDLVEAGPIILHFFNSTNDQDDIDITVAEQALITESKTIRAQTKEGYAKVVVAVLKEGQTELGENWANVLYQSNDLEIGEGIIEIVWKNIPVDYVLSYEDLDEDRNVIVRLFNSAEDYKDLAGVIDAENNKIKVNAQCGYAKAVVAVLKADQTELGQDWANVEYQSNDLELENNAASIVWKNKPAADVAYTFTVTQALPEGRVVIAHMWGDGLEDANKVLTINNLSLTCEAKDGYANVCIAVLKADQTELGENWANVDYKSEDLAIAEHAATWDNEVVTYTITLTNELDTENNIGLYLFNDSKNVFVLATVNEKVLTAEAKKGFTKVIVVVLKADQTELGENWTNKEAQYPVENGVAIVENAATVETPAKIDYVITAAEVESGRKVIVRLFNSAEDFEDLVGVVDAQNNKITVSSFDEYAKAVVAVLKADQTELGQDWANVDYQSVDLTLTENAAAVVWKNKVVSYVFTYTEIVDAGPIFVHFWECDVDAEREALDLAVEDANVDAEAKTITVNALCGYKKACVAVLKADQEELGENWVNVLYKSNDLEIENSAATITWKNIIRDFEFTYSDGYIAGRTVYAHFFNSAEDIYDVKVTVDSENNKFKVTCNSGYAKVIIVMLKADQTELDQNWNAVAAQSNEITIENNAGVVTWA